MDKVNLSLVLIYEYNNQNRDSRNEISKDGLELKLIKADKQDLKEHESRLLDIEERNSIKTLWREVH